MPSVWFEHCPTSCYKDIETSDGPAQRGMRSIVFIDHILMVRSPQELVKRTQEVIQLLQLLGFRINWEKSVLITSQEIIYLGFLINSGFMMLYLPGEKQKTIIEECKTALAQGIVSVRALARIIGGMTAASQAIATTPLYYRELQNAKNKVFKHTRTFEDTVRLSMESKVELQWWISEMEDWNGKSVLPQTPDMVIETDASLLGWGASMDSTATGGLWSEDERSHHINRLELKGSAFAVKAFAKERSNIHLRLRMDNTTAIAYVNHMGGTISQSLAQCALQLWQ